MRTRLDINPVHDWNNPLSMAYIHVDGTGMNAESCRYCISSGRNGVLFVLLLYSPCVGVVAKLVWAVSGILHNPFIMSLGPCMNILDLCLIVISCALNICASRITKIFN